MYNVYIIGDTRGILPQKTSFYVRHLRSREHGHGGIVNSTKGGFTIMVNTEDSHMFVAKCNDADNFNRRIGILTALQKYVGNVLIRHWNFIEDGIILDIDVNESESPIWLRKASSV